MTIEAAHHQWVPKAAQARCTSSKTVRMRTEAWVMEVMVVTIFRTAVKWMETLLLIDNPILRSRRRSPIHGVIGTWMIFN